MLAFITTINVSAQEETGDVVFCWNVERQLLEVQNVEYVSNENLLDPNNTGDRFPVITAITSTATSTTVSGTITFMISANDDNGIIRYSFTADLPEEDYLTIRKTQYVQGFRSDHIAIPNANIATLQFPRAGRWRTFFSVKDSANPGQSISTSGPDIIVE